MASKKNKFSLADYKKRRTVVFKRIKLKYEDCDLDDQVHEIMSLKASAINNAGVDAQLDFLAKEVGLDWLEQFYLES